MLLIALKRCTCHMEIRQFAMLHTYNRIQVKRQMMCHSMELKESNSRSPNITIQRFFNTNPDEDKQEYYLPQLMWDRSDRISLINIFFLSWEIRRKIDKEFSLIKFVAGATQAISVVSTALAEQKYEELDGIVKKRTVKVLKHRINLLSPAQRELLSVDPEYLTCAPRNVLIKKRKDTHDDIVEITMGGAYMKCSGHMVWDAKYVLLSYVFERKYTQGIGGSWIIKTLNHYTD